MTDGGEEDDCDEEEYEELPVRVPQDTQICLHRIAREASTPDETVRPEEVTRRALEWFCEVWDDVSDDREVSTDGGMERVSFRISESLKEQIEGIAFERSQAGDVVDLSVVYREAFEEHTDTGAAEVPIEGSSARASVRVPTEMAEEFERLAWNRSTRGNRVAVSAVLREACQQFVAGDGDDVDDGDDGDGGDDGDRAGMVAVEKDASGEGDGVDHSDAHEYVASVRRRRET